jgi:hypothetical protein
MSKSQEYLDRAENCAELAEYTSSLPARNRYKRMEAGWRALAREQQWLDGEIISHGDPLAAPQAFIAPTPRMLVWR